MRWSLLAVLLLVLFPAGALQAAGSLSEGTYRSANKLFAEARYEEAISLYRDVLANPPKNVTVADIHTKIGDSYFGMNAYKNALGAYRQALEVQHPEKKPESQYWVAFCTFLTGRDREAVEEFLKIPALYPDSGRWVSTAYYWAGRASERMGEKDQAAAYYKKAGGNGKSVQGRHAMKRAEKVKGSNTKSQRPNPK